MAKATAPDTTKPPSGPCTLVMSQDMPLGNGTRTRGEVVGTAERKDGIVDLKTLKPAEGFEAIEVATLERNPGLVEVQPDEAK